MTQVLGNQVPAPAAIGVPVATTVAFRVTGNRYPTSLTVTFSINAGPAIPVITAGVFQPGYAGTITPSGGFMDVVVTPGAPFPGGANVAVNVTTTGSTYSNPFNLNYQFGAGSTFAINAYSTWLGQTSLTVALSHYFVGAFGMATFINLVGAGALFSMARANPSMDLVVTFSGVGGTRTWTLPAAQWAFNTQHRWLMTYDGVLGIQIYRNGVNVTGLGAFAGPLPPQLRVAGPGSMEFRNIGLVNALSNFVDEYAVWPGLVFDADQIADYFNGGFSSDLMAQNRAFPQPADWYNFPVNLPLSAAGANYGVNAAPTGTFTGAVVSSSNLVAGAAILGLNNNYSFTTLGAAGTDADFYMAIRRLRTP